MEKFLFDQAAEREIIPSRSSIPRHPLALKKKGDKSSLVRKIGGSNALQKKNELAFSKGGSGGVR